MSEQVFEQLYNRLNEDQKKAVDTINGPVLVVAGPGSGKTEILSLRVAQILRKTDLYASNILCLTFTDSAAVNMRKRLSEIIGTEAYHVAVHTFHNFCVEVKNRYPEYFHKGAFFSPADELVQTEILEDIFSGLSHDNPIQSTHPEIGFVYLTDTRQAIGDLKKAGLTPEEFKGVLKHNQTVLESIEDSVHAIFSERVSKKMTAELKHLIDELSEITASPNVPHIRPLPEVLGLSLQRVVDAVEDQESTKPITEWKREHTRKEDKRRILKAQYYLPKMKALADVYELYAEEMYSRGYYDFDDMLLDVIQVLERNESLKAELQEQFQYILVDEFQDTNEAQMRLLQLLSNDPIHDRPNVMAVGDDDQAIYKFQGAEISNILNFKYTFSDPSVITMTTNYRSTQNVLNLARHVIQQGGERLEVLMDAMDKKLRAGNGAVEGGGIVHYSYPTRVHEYHALARHIEGKIAAGTPPDEIAVIGRYHSDLEQLVPFLHERKIPLSYERRQDVLSEVHIHQLVQMSRFIHSLSEKKRAEADEYLPEVLSYPFWGIDRKTIWKISLTAQREEALWIEVMLKHEDDRINEIAEFFLDVAAQATYDPVEYILDRLVGAAVLDVPDSEEVDITTDKGKSEENFISPYKQFYFSKEKFEENKSEYLTFLSSLKCFVRAIREYKEGRILKLSDLIEFVDVHENNNLLVTDTSPFVNADDAVQLLTAHKAKGMEFDTVFIISCQDSTWAGGRRRDLLPFPENLPISPAGDTLDDKLRLFYVALTRAKRHLYLLSHDYDEDGNEVLPVQFINNYDEFDEQKDLGADSVPDLHAVLETTVPHYNKPPFVENEKSLLRPLVEDYQLSVTHFNNFLDVTRGGPQAFLEQNLLRFPQPMAVPALYGAVVHKTLQRLYLSLKQEGSIPEKEAFLAWFEEELSKRRLSERDFDHFCKRGRKALSRFYDEKRDTFAAEHIIEFNFRQQGVVIDTVPITGKIDKMVKEGSTVRVHDFKTGRPVTRWKKGSIKLWRYKNQLLFYKLLVEHSRDFEDCEVQKGVLEFVEPLKDTVVDLELEIEDSDIQRARMLIQVVYEKIQNLEFPDIESYPNNRKGVTQFEDDLLNN